MRNRQFADDARALVRTAQERARALGHPGIGSEHLLFAVAAAPTEVGEVAREYGLTPDGVAAQTDRLLTRPRRPFDNVDAAALAAIGIDLDAVRDAVEANFGPAPAPLPRARRRPKLPGHLPITGRARFCLQAAVTEAGRRGVSPAGANHLGAVVVGTPGGLVPPILAALGISAPTLRAALLERTP
ncbi:Clp protease N-terminal domain-containing protein [Amycolatopsis sp. NPDC049253]|uniref:Clp protease N-terminal domain-containing protein n=1 Tax=Amycolatopsis sp. NPDC049253 TaxID=3155274 RepID=UPI0034416F62